MSAQSSLFADSGFSKRGKRIPPVEAVCAMARRLWPSKTAINLASRAEISERAAKLWLEGRTEPGADALVNLLRSDAGFELLQSIMEGSGTRGLIADGLLYASSFFHWVSVRCKNGALRVLAFGRRTTTGRADGGADITTKHTEING